MPFKLIYKLMIINLVVTSIFCLNAFPLSKPGIVLSNAKGPGKLVLGTVVEYKNFWRLQLSEYVQVNQEDRPQNIIDIYQKVWEIVLGPQYNLREGIF